MPLMCRTWSCDYCQPRRQAELIDLAKNGTPTRFITLTAAPSSGVSPADRARKLARAWRLVVARAKRQFKITQFDYLAVFEATKRGEPHLHILCRVAFIPQRWLSAQMREIMASPIVDIRLIRSPRQTAIYVAKYVGKEPHHFATCKRYWHTKNWVIADPRPAEAERFEGRGWVVVEKSLGQIYADWTGKRLNPVMEFDHTNRAGKGLYADLVSWGAGTGRRRAQPAAAEAGIRCLLHLGSRA